MFKFKLIIFLFFIFGCFQWAGANDWYVLSDSHFRIEYRAQDEKLAKSVQQILHEVRLPIVASVDYRPSEITQIVICSTEDDFVARTQNKAPEWGIGVAFPYQNLIVLKSPRLTKSLEDFDNVVAHEYSHIVVGQAVKGKSVPRWFHEGLAMYHARELGFTETITLSWASVRQKLLTLNDMTQTFPDDAASAQLAYMQSRVAISYIIDQHGEDQLRKLIANIQTTDHFERAIILTFHYNLEIFEKNYKKYLQNRWNLWTLVANTSIFWLGISILFLIAYWRKRWQANQKLKQWQNEDEWLGLSDDEYRDIWSNQS